MLLYATTDPVTSFEKEPALEIAKDDEIREMIWMAATCNRMNRGGIGSLLENRQKLIKILGKDDILVIPKWVIDEEQDLIKRFK